MDMGTEGANRCRRGHEPIAISGIACRFPGGADSPSSFWRNLRDEVDAVGEVPPERWSAADYYDPDPGLPGKMVSPRGAFLDDVAGFDASFFGITPGEAREMDPQQRLALELAWEALEDAGISPLGLAADPVTGAGAEIGVYQGVKFNDYEALKMRRGPTSANPFTSTGNVEGLIANRISYTLGLRGPSMTVNASCAASLVAVHLACQAIRSGECLLAIAGGVQLNLIPETAVALSKLGVISPHGRSSAFDATASGYVRGEGGGAVVLEPLSRAISAGRPVYSVIRGTATNNNGANRALPAPSLTGQEHLLRRACRNAGVDPVTIDYVEAHGTGTPLGDLTEMAALAAVYGAERSLGRPLLIGSVKTNIGHLEAAAGITGLIKLALSLREGTVPRSLHFERADLDLSLPESVRVAARALPWPQTADHPRRGGVSAFGFGGSNAHAILDAPPPVTAAAAAAGQASAVRDRELVVLSARTPSALRAQATRLASHLAWHPDLALRDIAFTAGHGRAHLRERLAVVASTAAEACERLTDFAEDVTPLIRGRTQVRGPGQMSALEVPGKTGAVFLFSGQGGQWAGMGRELLATEPVFADAVIGCDRAMRPYLDWSLLDALRGDGAAGRLEEVDLIQPAVFAMQVGLVALLREWGIGPQAVIGHSMGEVAAAVVAGAMTLDEACQVICVRSQIVRERARGLGAMAAVGLPAADVQAELAGAEGRVAIAAINAPHSTILSGDREFLENLLARLVEREVSCRFISVDYASHSPQMDKLTGELAERLAGVHGTPPSLAWFSTVTAGLLEEPPIPRYWVRNLRAPVMLADAVQAAWRAGHRAFAEIGPHPVLAASVREVIDSVASEAEADESVVATTLRRADSAADALLTGLGQLYCGGVEPDWRRLLPGARTVRLPTYPFEREHYWIGDDDPAVSAWAPSADEDTEVAPAVPEEASDPVAGPGTLRPGTVEAQVRQEVMAVLGLPRAQVRPETSFEDLGMTSLTATELQTALKRRLGMALTPATIWGHPTVRKLADHLERRLSSEHSPQSPSAAAPDVAAHQDASADLPSIDELIARGERLLGPLNNGAADPRRPRP
jgi:acyl transferase domain-containing protein